MTWKPDARLPVYFTSISDAPSDAAVLAEVGEEVPTGRPVERFRAVTLGHPAGCACCGPRSHAAQALSRLFVARGRGTVPFFSSVWVVAGNAGKHAVLDALARDPAVAAWFLSAGPLPTSEDGESSPETTPKAER